MVVSRVGVMPEGVIVIGVVWVVIVVGVIMIVIVIAGVIVTTHDNSTLPASSTFHFIHVESTLAPATIQPHFHLC